MASQCVPLFLKALPAAHARALREEFSLPPGVAEQAEHSLPLDTLKAFCRRCEERAQDPLFGFHVATSAVARGAYGLLEFVARHSATLEQSMGQVARYCGLINELVTIDFVPLPAGARSLTHRVEGVHDAVGLHCNEFFVVMITRIIREMVGDDFAPSAVRFAHQRTVARGPLEAWLRCPVTYDVGVNELRASKASLARPIVGADHALLPVLEAQADRVLESRPRRHERLTERVLDLLPQVLPNGGPALEPIAARLHMSARTLQRQLDAEGTRFALLLDGHRKARCLEWLGSGRRPSEIAWLLGYAEPRSFSRAFQRWTGKTPRAWRDEH